MEGIVVWSIAQVWNDGEKREFRGPGRDFETLEDAEAALVTMPGRDEPDFEGYTILKVYRPA